MTAAPNTPHSRAGLTEGSVRCSDCGATVAWEGEPPTDCIKCGADFPVAPGVTVPVFTFEVYATGFGEVFEPFVLDVPSLSGEDFAARRAWWSVFHLLGPRGIEPEDFEVRAYDGTATGTGRLVSSGGFVS